MQPGEYNFHMSEQQRFDTGLTHALSITKEEMKRRLAEAKAENRAKREAAKDAKEAAKHTSAPAK